VFLFFAREASNLPNAGKIIVQQRVHGGGRFPLQSIAPMRGECVPKCARGEKRDRTERKQRQFETDVTHHCKHEDHLQQGDESLFDTVD